MVNSLSFGDIGVPSILTIAGIVWIALGLFANVSYWGIGVLLLLIGIILFVNYGSHN